MVTAPAIINTVARKMVRIFALVMHIGRRAAAVADYI